VLQRTACLFLIATVAASAHAPPIFLPTPPFRVQGPALVDSTNTGFLMRGVQMSGLDAANPTPVDTAAVAAMTPLTFRLIQQRWNTNTLRLPVSTAVWRRDGLPYLNRIAAIVKSANQEHLLVVLAAFEAAPTGLPTPDTLDFWKAAAAFFKETPALIFDIFNQPSTLNIPGASPAQHRPGDWDVWLNGGVLAGGQRSIGMQALVDAIRAAGAEQVVAVSSFHDPLDFQGFTPANAIRDPNVIYEAHPFYDHGITTAQLDANLWFLHAKYPVYAGEWGMPFGQNTPACRAIPLSVTAATDLLNQTLDYFDTHEISWTVTDFRPGSLIQDFTDETATALDAPGTCDPSTPAQPGIGVGILLWLTEDEGGFGSIQPDQIANAAGGPAGPVAPGELIAIFGQGLGPADPVGAQLDASGKVSTRLADAQVFFDDIPAPIILSYSFEMKAQVPYEVAGRPSAIVRLAYRDVPSNRITVALTPSAPEIFTTVGSLTDAAALNQDGTLNSQSNPAQPGSIVVLFATGSGITSPPSITGALAPPPYAPPALPVTAEIATAPVEILFAGSAPGLAGVLQVNARVPAALAGSSFPTRAAVTLRVGAATSRPGVSVWIK
jgi:uncharacterized protein (TIGR03437 family)